MNYMEEEIETRIVVISPDSVITPEKMKSMIMNMDAGVTVKETCYGVLVEGRKDDVRKVIEEVRTFDRNGIYTKIRGFPIGDERICRATRSGGPRPGFHQLELEYLLLPMIRKALNQLEKGDISIPEVQKKKKIPVEDLKGILAE
ncbi:MAG: methanogenesis marker 6 protein [Candidatus Syntropharchaeia archaeon]